MQRLHGEMLIGTGLLHTVVGVGLYARPLVEIGRAGLVNSIDAHAERREAFWFLMTGALVVTLGHLTCWLQRLPAGVPPLLGWHLLGFAIPGVILMPISGFWLILPQAILILRRGRGDAFAAAAPPVGTGTTRRPLA
jgi:hypothetical protein